MRIPVSRFIAGSISLSLALFLKSWRIQQLVKKKIAMTVLWQWALHSLSLYSSAWLRFIIHQDVSPMRLFLSSFRSESLIFPYLYSFFFFFFLLFFLLPPFSLFIFLSFFLFFYYNFHIFRRHFITASSSALRPTPPTPSVYIGELILNTRAFYLWK